MNQNGEDNSEKSKIPSFPLFDFPIERVKEQARVKLEETPEKVQKGIQAMKKFIKENNARGCYDDELLLQFLRVKKFRHSDSCKMLQEFFKSLKLFYKKLGPMNGDLVKMVLKKNIAVLLPYRDPAGRVNLCYTFGIMIKEGITAKENMLAVQLASFAVADEQTTQTVGANFIVDCRNMTLREIYENIDLWITFCRCLAKLPVRVHRVDILNEPPIIKKVLNMLIPFVPRKVVNRINLHGGNFESLWEHYERSALPDGFGGTAGPVSNDHWIERVDEIVKRFERLQKTVISDY